MPFTLSSGRRSFMRLKRWASLVLLAALPYLNTTMASEQVQPEETVWEARPKVVSAIDVLPRTRLETSRLMLDTYWLRESCTSCSQGSVNMIGVTFNLYFRQLK